MRPLSAVDLAEYCASVSMTSGNIRGGAVGGGDVADEADEVRDDEPIAEAGNPLVAAESDPEQRRRPTTANCSQYVNEVSVTRIDDVSTTLDGRLEERPSPRSVRRPLAVLESVGEALRSGCAAGNLVHDVEPHPDDDLEGEMRPAAGEAP